MATLPASGYLSDPARTKAEMQTAFEDQRDFIAHLLGGSALVSVAVAAGTIIPTQAIHVVTTEGGAPDDYLDNIDDTNMGDGSFLLLLGHPSESIEVTVRDQQGGAGQIFLGTGTTPGSTIDACPLFGATSGLLLYNWGGFWYEITRSYDVLRMTARGGAGSEIPSRREHYGLGSAAEFENGDANLDAGKLNGLPASSYVLTSDPVGDADTLDGLHANEFVQLALTSQQIIGGNLRTQTGRFVARAVSGGAPGVELVVDDGVGVDEPRGILFFNDVDNAVYLRITDTDGTTVQGQIRLTDAGVIEFDDATGGGFRDLQDALLLEGSPRSELVGYSVGSAALGSPTEFSYLVDVPAAPGGSSSSTASIELPRGTIWYGLISHGESGVTVGNLRVHERPEHYVVGPLTDPADVHGRTTLVFENFDVSGAARLRVKGYYLSGIGPT